MKNETGRKAIKFHLCPPSEANVCGPTFGKLSLPHKQGCLETGKLPSKLFSMYSEALYLEPWHYKNKHFHSWAAVRGRAVFLTLAQKEKTWGLWRLFFLNSFTREGEQLKLHAAPHQIFKYPCTDSRGWIWSLKKGSKGRYEDHSGYKGKCEINRRERFWMKKKNHPTYCTKEIASKNGGLERAKID